MCVVRSMVDCTGFSWHQWVRQLASFGEIVSMCTQPFTTYQGPTLVTPAVNKRDVSIRSHPYNEISYVILQQHKQWSQQQSSEAT